MTYSILTAEGTLYACGPHGEKAVQVFDNPEVAERWIHLLKLEGATVVPAYADKTYGLN